MDKISLWIRSNISVIVGLGLSLLGLVLTIVLGWGTLATLWDYAPEWKYTPKLINLTLTLDIAVLLGVVASVFVLHILPAIKKKEKIALINGVLWKLIPLSNDLRPYCPKDGRELSDDTCLICDTKYTFTDNKGSEITRDRAWKIALHYFRKA